MCTSFNQLLVSPTEAALVAALDTASRRVRESQGRDWVPLLVEVMGLPDGRMQVEGLAPIGSATRYVSVAWWTDHQGRKLVRVVGGDAARLGKDLHHCRGSDDPRPPLWHICPERVYLVKRGDEEPVWLASCACGEIGTPPELGWDGERCGPCHDRREEGEHVEQGPLSWIDALPPVHALAFDPDGRRLAVSAGDRVSLVELRTGDERVIAVGDDDDSFRPLAFSPDGMSLAGGDANGDQVRVWTPLPNGDLDELDLTGPAGGVAGLAFSPDGTCLASVDGEGELQRWGLDERGMVTFEAWMSGVLCAAFHPVGESLAAGRLGSAVTLTRYDDDTEAETFRLGEDEKEGIYYLEFTPDGESLVAITAVVDGDLGHPWHIRQWSLSLRRQTQQVGIAPPTAVAMSPDGRYLAFLRHDQNHSPAAVHFWDLEELWPAGWIEWNSEEDLRCLAFSNDGRWLATGSESGVVKLWPWRELLEG